MSEPEYCPECGEMLDEDEVCASCAEDKYAGELMREDDDEEEDLVPV